MMPIRADPESNVAELEDELATADETAARLERENAALGGASAASASPGSRPAKADGAVYRAADRRASLEHAIQETHARIAALRIDNEILRSVQDRRLAERRRPWLPRAAGVTLLIVPPAAILALTG